MSETEKRIMGTLERVVPGLSGYKRDLLLAYGEGFAAGAERPRGERVQDSA